MSRLIPVKVIRFGLVGMAGMVIDFGVTWLLRDRLHVNQFMANSAGFTCALINNYWLNRHWTFEKKGTPVAMQFTRFVLVSLIGLGLNNGLLYLLVSHTTVNFYLLKLCVIGIVFVWNYTANLFFTFAG